MQYVKSLCFHLVPGYVWTIGDAEQGLHAGDLCVDYTMTHIERNYFSAK